MLWGLLRKKLQTNHRRWFFCKKMPAYRRHKCSALDLGHWRLKYFQQNDPNLYLRGKRCGVHVRHHQPAIIPRFRRLAWASNENVRKQRTTIVDVDWQQSGFESHASRKARSADEVCQRPQDEALLLFSKNWGSSLRCFLSACSRSCGSITH